MVQTLHKALLGSFLAVMFIGSASAATFNGQLVSPASPILVQGAIEAEVSGSLMAYAIRPNASGVVQESPFFSASSSRISISEVHRPTPLGSSPPGPASDAHVTLPQTSFQSRDTRISIVQLDELSRWSGRSWWPPEGETRVSSNASCDVWNGNAWRQGGPHEVDTDAASGVAFAVVADCRADSFDLSGPTELMLFGSTFHLVDSNGHDMVLRTGRYKQYNPVLPAPHYEEVERVLMVRSSARDAALDLDGPSTAVISSPMIAVGGTLQIAPDFEGNVQWGSSEIRDGFQSIQPSGAFLFRAPSDNFLMVDGETSNGPVEMAAAPVPPEATAAPDPVNAVVAGVTLLIVLWFLRRTIPLFASLFTRLTMPTVLDAPTRSMIIERVRASPGISLSSLARVLGMAYSTIRYNVRVMERYQLVATRNFGREALVFLPTDVSPAEQKLAIRLRNPSVRTLLQELRNGPTATQAQLANRVGLSQARVNQLLKDLELRGLVRVERAPHSMRYDVLVPSEISG